MNVREHLLGFNGRIDRLSYNVPAFAIGIPVAVYLALMTSPMVLLEGSKAAPGGTIPWYILATVLPFAWIQAALLTKRAHDLGYSGWDLIWKHVNLLIMSGLFAIMVRLAKKAPETWFVVATIAAGCWLMWLLVSAAWFYLKVMFYKGSPDPNVFGFAPRQLTWRL